LFVSFRICPFNGQAIALLIQINFVTLSQPPLHFLFMFLLFLSDLLYLEVSANSYVKPYEGYYRSLPEQGFSVVTSGILLSFYSENKMMLKVRPCTTEANGL
ncbi:hypothetical protein, partial [uncultured Bacteroides sp.]|uniref:hypothetical protein n=1 Tax=uncultured Bacteroides sp. TaxID=162156 RepID=UPI0025E17FC6